MALYNWTKIPKDQIERVKNAVNDYDLDDLLDMYYEHKIGKVEYCCPFHGMYLHYKDALENNLIG